MSLTIEYLEEWLGNGINQVNLKFNDLSEIVNFCDKKGDIMAKVKAFAKRTQEQKDAFVRANTTYMNKTAYRRLINAERFSKLICKHLKIKVEDESVDFTKDLDEQ